MLHGRDVLATTVLQTCIRYQSRTKTCQFCAIGQSLAAGRTVARKTPAQLAEVAKAAVELDGVKHMVMTTGTPPGRDRGAAMLAESAAAIKAAVDLPIQGQCEPPDDDVWFRRMHDAGVDALGHASRSGDPAAARAHHAGQGAGPARALFRRVRGRGGRVRARPGVDLHPGRSRRHAERRSSRSCGKLIALGVYPFVVPFVPIAGTPLESHPAPAPAFMHAILRPLATMLRDGALRATDIKAGCGKCGACSALSTYEREAVA